jgi:hypothetical protein
MFSHKLPNDGKDELFVAIHNVEATYIHKRELHFLTENNSVVTVRNLLKLGFGLVVHSSPRNSARLHSIHDLKQGIAILEVREQIIDVKIGDVEGVDPHSEHSLLSGVSSIIEVKTSKVILSKLFLCDSKTRASIKKLGNET